jgi:NTP pyrophosphatase (non-canonical NTP hydrolase)
MNPLQDLKLSLRQFAQDRDWDQFHFPKNLTMALPAEAGELTECFQWLTEEQSQNMSADQKAAAGEEIADVLLYLIRLSDKLDIDVAAAAEEKIKKNAEKYPIDLAKGNAQKYDTY